MSTPTLAHFWVINAGRLLGQIVHLYPRPAQGPACLYRTVTASPFNGTFLLCHLVWSWRPYPWPLSLLFPLPRFRVSNLLSGHHNPRDILNHHPTQYYPNTQVKVGLYQIESQALQGNFNSSLPLLVHHCTHKGNGAFLEKIGVHQISDVEVNPDVGKGLWQSEQLQ